MENVSGSVLGINSAERSPPETGLMATALTHVKYAQLMLIPASAQTRGHATTMIARLWARQMLDFLTATPKQM